MNQQEVLSQEEVDNLLRGITGEPQEKKPTPVVDPNGIRKYNLGEQERIVRARMPTLEIINERFIRNLRVGLFSFTRKNPDISVLDTKVQKFSSFLSELVVPTNLNIVTFKPLRGSGLITCEPRLIFSIIDTLFGGGGKFHTRIEGRDFSATEMRVIKKLLDVFAEEFKKAWSGIYPLEFEYQRSEMQPQFVNISAPNEVVISTSFKIDFADSSGLIYITIPYATLEPIKDTLYSSVQGDNSMSDKRWGNAIKSQIKDAQVEMKVELGKMQANLQDLLNMKVGDFFPLLIEPTVTASIDGLPVFSCHYGKNNGRYAVKIDKRIEQEQEHGDHKK